MQGAFSRKPMWAAYHLVDTNRNPEGQNFYKETIQQCVGAGLHQTQWAIGFVVLTGEAQILECHAALKCIGCIHRRKTTDIEEENEESDERVWFGFVELDMFV